MTAAATPRAARAFFLFAAAFVLVFILISAAERLGHPHGGRLIGAFAVTFGDTVPETVQTVLHDESYRYHSPESLRAARFSTDIAPQVRGLKEPALLITDAYAFVSVKLNGVPLSDQGGRDGPIPDRQFEPRLYYLSSALRGDPARDAQILTIDLRGEGRPPFLREVFLSETKDGILAYRMRRFVSIEGVVAATAIAVFAGLLSLAVTPLLEYRTLSGIFAFMMLLWGLRNYTFVGAISDVPWPVQQAAYYASTFLILVTTVLLINYWTTNSRFIRRYFVIALVGVLFMLYLPALLNMPGGVAISRQVGNFVGIGCFIMMIGQLIYALIQDDNPPWFEMFLFLVCLSVGVIEVGGDAYPEFTRWIWPDTGLSMAYGPLMPLPLAAGMLVNFVRRTVKVRDQLRMDNATLAGLVAAREAEIAKVYAEREAEVRQSALMMERQRIMRDMHDGIGSQLLGLLFQARGRALEPEVLTQGLQESLDDLNLVVESLDQSDHGLEQALGAFRARIAPKLDSAGIRLDWEMGDLEHAAGSSPARVLQIYRILQEACINAMRHGRPTRILIRSGPNADGGIDIVVEDDGAGFDASTPQRRGRGLSNMRKRAEAAGGTLSIDSAPGRTRLTLQLPASTHY